MVSQIINNLTVCLIAYAGQHQREHQSSALPALCERNHLSSMDSPHKGPVMREKFPSYHGQPWQLMNSESKKIWSPVTCFPRECGASLGSHCQVSATHLQIMPRRWKLQVHDLQMNFSNMDTRMVVPVLGDMCHCDTGLIVGLHPANERCHYEITPSLIGWAQT